MSNRAATYLIMTLVAILVICGILASHPASGARDCLDRERAARTWPTKQLGVDGDGCFTFLRRGVKAAPDDLVKVPAAASVEAEPLIMLDLLQRWPAEMMRVETVPEITRPEPAMMSTRDVVTVILVVILTCAVFEVAFGGFWSRKGQKDPRMDP